jgi:hypothetical protein
MDYKSLVMFPEYSSGYESHNVPVNIINEDAQFTCPVCNNIYVHFRSAQEYKGEHEGRLNVVLEFSCEDGHHYLIDFRQTHGQTYVSYLVIGHHPDYRSWDA